ncbi:carbohydrate ABC transporter permease [Enemella sp. A6]|uniref:carbohydrate ABC transporter permease n=1 Tax=Enemella sp. A6 TaxID=3440152 RepID=UPI003EBB31FA
MLDKFGQMFLAIGVLVAVAVVLLLLASLARGRHGDRVRALFFVGPTVLLVAIGLIYPTVLTIVKSFRGADGAGSFSMSNYVTIFTREALRSSILNTAIWVLLVPLLAIAIGLLYAIIVDRTPIEAFAKTLIFLPMAISMVGASVIWKFVYEYKPTQADQVGLLNQVIKMFGGETRQFLVDSPWNNFFLIVVMIWIQAGFAMTVLSAAIKAIPDEIIEAARIDGASGWSLFWQITLPSIRASLIMVITTIAIAALKVFDIVRTMTGGNWDTSVVANDFYSASFTQNQPGLGSALAVLLFVLVAPIIVYNVRQLREAS